MNESENLWNVDSLLKLSEDLQVENEQYRSLLAQKENQIQMHLSDVQKLKSQIRSMQSTIAEQGQEIQKLNAHIARLAESDLVLVENQKLIEANRRLQAENEKAQNTFKEAVTKTEDAKRILAQAKALFLMLLSGKNNTIAFPFSQSHSPLSTFNLSANSNI